VKYADGGGSYRIERNADNADWKLAGLKPGEKLDASRANAASYSLSLLTSPTSYRKTPKTLASISRT
jgi:hypothetical protein